MAFAAVLAGTLVSLTTLVVAIASPSVAPLSAVGIALLAGQGSFALVLGKAMLCQSLRRARQNDRAAAAHAR